MNDVNMILDLIETVDSTDMKKLDEIDARVWCEFFAVDHGSSPKRQGRMRFVGINNGMAVGGVDGGGFHEVTFSKPLAEIRYTRSRDGLKEIRPNGCRLICGHNWATAIAKSKEFYGNGATEELAELHAIIQAVTYGRGEL